MLFPSAGGKGDPYDLKSAYPAEVQTLCRLFRMIEVKMGETEILGIFHYAVAPTEV